MRPSRDQPSKQCLSYPLRLPNEAQAAALRLLDVSRAVINLTVSALWDRLDAFYHNDWDPAEECWTNQAAIRLASFPLGLHGFGAGGSGVCHPDPLARVVP